MFDQISPENVRFLETAFLPEVSSDLTFASDEERALFVEKRIMLYRLWGHLQAHFLPEAIGERVDVEKITPVPHLPGQFPTCGLRGLAPLASFDQIEKALKEIYASTSGYEFWPFCSDETNQWLIEQIEQRAKEPISHEKKRDILQKLICSEAFETFLHTRFVGQKRFSLEGAETLVVMLEELVEQTAAESIIIGASHRGRLNVMAHVLQKAYGDIYSEFEDLEADFEGSGDVKYHKGYFCTRSFGQKNKSILLAANPSHLESVDPVVCGMARGQKNSLAILIHGDAAFSGQGVVYETLQLARLKGYSIGGVIHIVINNHIGFTTVPEDSRSTTYCTDIAKAFGMPVFHVNAEDPEECIRNCHLALGLKERFGQDVCVDLNCFRKYGHNESDEPAFTQPKLYKKIRSAASLGTRYATRLVQEQVVTEDEVRSLYERYRGALLSAHGEKRPRLDTNPPQVLPDPVATAIGMNHLQEIAKRIYTIPEGFGVHTRIRKQFDERQQSESIDWAEGEALALATLLEEGVSVRLSGQDTRRGTFSQRHSVLVDQETEEKYFPLASCAKEQGQFEVIDSPLSEYAALGFEYGFSLVDTNFLVLWEAQFGDFANGAQVIIDQYIASGAQKWGSKSRLVLLLPHGYEGQGPEHSSARIERFLTLCAQDNMSVCHPTTPAQLFHLIRRQAKTALIRPLVIFTPKGLLRHPQCKSMLTELATGSFQSVLDDPLRGSDVELLIFCQGRMYYDLAGCKRVRCAIIRIEELYPFPQEDLVKLIASYSMATRFYWVQEEPANMGAWNYISDKLQELLPKNAQVEYRGRPASSSPAVGSHLVHEKEHRRIMESLLPYLEVQ